MFTTGSRTGSDITDSAVTEPTEGINIVIG